MEYREMKMQAGTERPSLLGFGCMRFPKTPEEYLMQHGAYTPDGRRIALYPHPVEGVDALSLSLYQMIDEAVEVGKLEFPELESDEL